MTQLFGGEKEYVWVGAEELVVMGSVDESWRHLEKHLNLFIYLSSLLKKYAEEAKKVYTVWLTENYSHNSWQGHHNS